MIHGPSGHAESNDLAARFRAARHRIAGGRIVGDRVAEDHLRRVLHAHVLAKDLMTIGSSPSKATLFDQVGIAIGSSGPTTEVLAFRKIGGLRRSSAGIGVSE